MDWSVAWFNGDDILRSPVGSVVTIHNKRFLLMKKTTTAISVRRWYWWDELICSVLRWFA